MSTSETYRTTATKLKRVTWLSSQEPSKQFGCLMHYFNAEFLRDCYHELPGNKAVGADGVDKTQYGEALELRLADLEARLKRMAYKPQPVRQVWIPKEGQGNKRRPLGISAFEDKLVQKVMHNVLESIYEPIFLESSYGFRPGRGCHDAISALQSHLYNHHVRMVIDIDIENFFGTIDHKLLEDLLRQKISDERLLRYLKRMFKAGILTQGELQVSEEGVAQGNLCSPILANLFAHYVIDVWFEDTVKRHCRGEVKLFRYCDDAVICCQNVKMPYA